MTHPAIRRAFHALGIPPARQNEAEKIERILSRYEDWRRQWVLAEIARAEEHAERVGQ